MLLIRNVTPVDWKKTGLSTCDLLIEDGIIADISDHIDPDGEATVIDGVGLTAFPAFTDVHVHLREPGYEYKETISSGTKSAASGGITTLCSMPNINPCPDNPDSYRMVARLVKEKSLVETIQTAAINHGLSGMRADWNALYEAGARVFTNDGMAVADPADMADVLAFTRDHQAFVSEHAEVRNLNSSFGGGEEIMVARDLMINQLVRGKLHLAHISTAKSVELLKEARRNGIPFTAETCPHYFTAIKRTLPDSWYEVYPPLRSEEDIEAIKWALNSGLINTLASDHAPHAEEEKSGPCPARGFSGVELLFVMGYNELVRTGLISMERLLKSMVYYPSILLGRKPVCFEKGNRADITLVDLQKDWTITGNALYSKGKNSPFLGRSVRGEVVHTIMNGNLIFSR